MVWASFMAISLVRDFAVYTTFKEDIAEINKVNYGLFNLQLWKKEAMTVFQNRIEDFDIDPAAYKEVEKELEKYLRNINKDYVENGKIFDNIFNEAEKSEKINKVFLKMIKDNVGVQIQNLQIQKFIPGMAVELAKELKKQEPRIKDIMRAELRKMLQSPEDDTYIDPRDKIYQKYKVDNLADANEVLKIRIEGYKLLTDNNVRNLYVLLLLIMLISFFSYKVIGFNLMIALVTLNSVIMLVVGVSLPMIDLEALLNSFSLNVLGTNINFDTQVMYFQSKSILDVTRTLLDSRGWDLKIVGLLILMFSIVFPFFKLVLSALYLYSRRLQNSKLVQNFIFYLGKWSMADVFVVAMFMAYIGFYGLLTAQMGDIAGNRNGFAVETINNSKLSAGALFFTTYCILSIITGILINRRTLNMVKEKDLQSEI